MRLEIRKMGYSSHPWRLVDLDRFEDGHPVQVVIPVPIDHATLGRTTIDEAVSGNTKTECIQQTLDLLGTILQMARTGRQRS